MAIITWFDLLIKFCFLLVGYARDVRETVYDASNQLRF